jgi:hypothetical protein
LISFIVLASIGALIGAMFLVEAESNARFFKLLAQFKVGQPYADVEHILGQSYRTLTEPDDIKVWGEYSKDSNCNNLESECNLHMFLRMDFIPHKFIMIYENKKTHLVQCVTWGSP